MATHLLPNDEKELMESDDALEPPSLKPIASSPSTKTYTSVQPDTNVDGTKYFDLWRLLVLDILRSTACYKLMPESGKVVVFDSCLTLKHAFRALSEHDIKCAPVWASNNGSPGGDFVGFMTVTDFADILHHYALDIHSYSQRIVELETFAVGKWCTFRKKHSSASKNTTNCKINKKFVYCEPDESLFNAIYKMHRYFIHRMPIKIDQAIGCILNHQNILRFVFSETKKHHAELRGMRVKDLDMPYDQKKYKTVTYGQKVIVAVNMLCAYWERSAIPICDENGAVINAFMRSDIRFFARNQSYMKATTTSIESFLTKYRHFAVPRCKAETPLLDVYEEMLNKRCHVALVLDEKDKLLNVFNCAQTFEMIIKDENPIQKLDDKFQSIDQEEQVTESLDISSHFNDGSNQV